MKVTELIEKLKQFDPKLHVFCCTEDSDFLPSGHLFRLLEIDEVSIVEGENCRGDDLVPSRKLVHSELSEKHVVIGVTADS